MLRPAAIAVWPTRATRLSGQGVSDWHVALAVRGGGYLPWAAARRADCAASVDSACALLAALVFKVRLKQYRVDDALDFEQSAPVAVARRLSFPDVIPPGAWRRSHACEHVTLWPAQRVHSHVTDRGRCSSYTYAEQDHSTSVQPYQLCSFTTRSTADRWFGEETSMIGVRASGH